MLSIQRTVQVLFFFILGSGSFVWAQEQSAEDKGSTLTIDVRLLGGPIGNFIDEPSETDKVVVIAGSQYREPYSGFAGMGWTAGLGLGVRYEQWLGIDTGIYTRSENAEASYTLNGQKFDIEVSQESMSIPLLLRLTLPGESVNWSVLGGWAFHMPSKTELKSLITNLNANAESYRTLNFGTELEFKLTSIKGHDIRIPLSLRGHHNQDLGTAVGERVDFEGCVNATSCQRVYVTEWQWTAEILLGLSWHRDFVVAR